MKKLFERQLTTYCELHWWNMGKKTLSFKGELNDLLKEQNIKFSIKKTDNEHLFQFYFKNGYGISFKKKAIKEEFTEIAKTFIQMELVRVGDKAKLYVSDRYRHSSIVTVNF